jgi:hypothetical protein
MNWIHMKDNGLVNLDNTDSIEKASAEGVYQISFWLTSGYNQYYDFDTAEARDTMFDSLLARLIKDDE